MSEGDSTATRDRDLASDFPGWHIRQSRTGEDASGGWYATRAEPSRAAREGRGGLFMTVTGATEDELREELEVQAEREAAL